MTLNQIKKILIDYFNYHAMVNDVFYMDDFDFNAERKIHYPVVNIEYINSNISNKQTNHLFKVLVGDINATDNNEMVDNIISDSLQVAEDFFTFLQNYEGFIFSKSSSINKYVDDTGDRVCGIVFTFTLSVIRPQNRCWTPTK